MIRAAFLALLMLLAPAAVAQDHDDRDDHNEEQHEHEHDDHDHEDSDHVAELNGVRAIHAWTRATSGRTALVFVELENGTAGTVTLLGGEAGNAEMVTLVGFQLVDGEPTYVPLSEMPVGAEREVVLAPNGLALELAGLTGPLVEGEHFEMEIEFDIGHLPVVVEIESASATQHSHAGHNH